MLTCEIDRTLPVTVLQLTGDLRLGTVHEVRAALLKCLVECPAAVVVDLSGAWIASRTSLTVFGAVTRRADPWPPVPLVVAASPPEIRAQLESLTRLWQIPVYASVTDARVAASDRAARPVSRRSADTKCPFRNGG